MSGSGECRLEGLCIKASPLGENDRLITILTDEQGIVRLAVPGARRPKSNRFPKSNQSCRWYKNTDTGY